MTFLCINPWIKCDSVTEWAAVLFYKDHITVKRLAYVSESHVEHVTFWLIAV